MKVHMKSDTILEHHDVNITCRVDMDQFLAVYDRMCGCFAVFFQFSRDFILVTFCYG